MFIRKLFSMFPHPVDSFPHLAVWVDVGCVALEITLYLTPPEHVFLVRKTIYRPPFFLLGQLSPLRFRSLSQPTSLSVSTPDSH